MKRIYDFVDEGLGHSSYAINLGNGTGAVVDPPRFPIAHEALLERLNLRLAWTLDTHSRADYVSGSTALADRTGATFVAPAASHLASPHRPVTDNEHVLLADGFELVAWATPGHTPDHHAYVLVEDGAPVASFSGGSLMVGTVGRTDLNGPELAVPLAHGMFAALRRFDQLPDELAVYPTHGAGSFCSAPGAAQRTSTLGHERATNPQFSITDEDEFIERLVEAWTDSGRPTCTIPLVEPVATTGPLIDVRQANEYAFGHVPGALNVEPGAVSETGLPVGPLTVMCGHGERAMTAASILTVCGRDDVSVLDGGPDTWSAATGNPLETGR